MKKIFCVSLASLAFAFVSQAGSITGIVRAEGRVAAGDASCGAYDSRKFKFATRVNYDELRDFVVFIVGPVGANAAPPTTHAQVVTAKQVFQKGAVFSPHVLPILVGTTVEWPNEDAILHNVFSISDTKPFDLDLYKGNPPEKAVTFDKPGRVDVFCSIHERMSCVVLVLENPHFAATDDRGRYVIAGVPAGKYKLKAWHERLPARTEEITVPESGDLKVDFVLGWPGSKPVAKN